MPRTSSGAISNSAAKQFSNCEGRIANDNYNRIIAGATIYEQMEKIKGVKSLPVNKYPQFQPKSIIQVIKQTGLK